MFDRLSGMDLRCYPLSSEVQHTTPGSTRQSCVTANPTCRSCGFLWRNTCCSGGGESCSTVTVPPATHIVRTPIHSGVVNGLQIHTDAPYMHICRREQLSSRWDRAGPRLCGNFAAANRGSNEWIADAAACWRWACPSGLAQAGDGACVNEEQCLARGEDWQGGGENPICIPFNWCTGWAGPRQPNGFNPVIHMAVPVGPCHQFRCRYQVPTSTGVQATPAGTFERRISERARADETEMPHALASAASRTCVPVVNMTGVRAGSFVDRIDGVRRQCGADQFTIQNPSTGDWGCQQIVSLSGTRFEGCWGCRSREDLIRCLQSSETPSATNSLRDCFVPPN